MRTKVPAGRPLVAARRVGYVIAAVVVAVAGSLVGVTVNLVALIRRAAHSGGPGTVGRRAL